MRGRPRRRASAIPTGSAARLVAELGPSRRDRGDGAHERAATGHARATTATSRTCRRNGWRRPSRRRRASACSTCAPRQVASRRRSPPRAPMSSATDIRCDTRSVWSSTNTARLGARGVDGRGRRARRRRSRGRSFDAVLIDAPCSGLGALRRRPDARWRIEPADVDDAGCAAAAAPRRRRDARRGRAAGWCTACARSRRRSRWPTRSPTGSTSTRRPPGGTWRAVPARLAGAPARRRHRRDDHDSVPSPDMSNPTSTRPRRQGADRQRRSRPRHPRRRQRAGARRPADGRAGSTSSSIG